MEIKLREDIMPAFRYFVDDNGVIYTITDSGKSNFPSDFEIQEASENGDPAKVLVLGDHEDGDPSQPREVNTDYQLWDSLVALAKAIED